MTKTDKNKEALEKAESAFEKDYGEGSLKEIERIRDKRIDERNSKVRAEEKRKREIEKERQEEENRKKQEAIEKRNQEIALKNFQEEHYEKAKSNWVSDKLNNDKRIKDMVDSGKYTEKQLYDNLKLAFDDLVEKGKIKYETPTELPMDYKNMGEKVNLDKRTVVKGAESNWNRIFRKLAKDKGSFVDSTYAHDESNDLFGDVLDDADEVIDSIRKGVDNTAIQNKIVELMKKYPNLLGKENYPFKNKEGEQQDKPARKPKGKIKINLGKKNTISESISLVLNRSKDISKAVSLLIRNK